MAQFKEEFWITNKHEQTHFLQSGDFLQNPTAVFVDYLKFSQCNFENLIDKNAYRIGATLLWRSLIKPLIDNDVLWCLQPKNEDDAPDILLPAQFVSLRSAREFWFKYADKPFDPEGVAIAYFTGLSKVKALFSGEGVFWRKRSGFLRRRSSASRGKTPNSAALLTTIWVWTFSSTAKN